jgi:hypothetical protein
MADAVEEGKAMRKDEALEEEAGKAQVAEFGMEMTDKTGRTMDLEEELKDDELLGESTLAKLTPIPAAVEPDAGNADVADVANVVDVAEDKQDK